MLFRIICAELVKVYISDLWEPNNSFSCIANKIDN